MFGGCYCVKFAVGLGPRRGRIIRENAALYFVLLALENPRRRSFHFRLKTNVASSVRRVSAIFLDDGRAAAPVRTLTSWRLAPGQPKLAPCVKRSAIVVFVPRPSERGRRTLNLPLVRLFVCRRDVCRNATAPPRLSRRYVRLGLKFVLRGQVFQSCPTSYCDLNAARKGV